MQVSLDLKNICTSYLFMVLVGFNLKRERSNKMHCFTFLFFQSASGQRETKCVVFLWMFFDVSSVFRILCVVRNVGVNCQVDLGQ